MFFSTAPAPSAQPSTRNDGAPRRPAVAGQFYPADPAALRQQVREALRQAPDTVIRPKAVIVPHAGYMYSGQIAASAYRAIASLAGTIRRVVLMGPPHRRPVRGFCVPRAASFASPLGEVRIDRDLIKCLADLPECVIDDAPHEHEHSLETQLPFLQETLGTFTLLPILVGALPAEAVDRLLKRVWGDEHTLIVISSDLSHYLDYDAARAIDESARRMIETLQGDRLSEDQACGRHAIRGLLSRAAALDLRATTLDLRNSGDTAGRAQRDRVVGYGSWAFEYASRARLTDPERAQLARVARQAISIHLRQGRMPRVDTTGFSRSLQAIRASFVTLTLDGELRGCIGSVIPHAPLVEDVAANACKAAFQDPRFKPLSVAEAARLQVSVSILSHPRSIEAQSERGLVDALHPEEDGVILEGRTPDGQIRRGLFLPHVWEQLRRPEAFVQHLKAKAGLPPEGWPAGVRAWRFGTEHIH
ncbi:MAG: hypothetical protein RL322_1761 [Pseudomonadota bacterium]|jgi:AmmeMemoRadiSam system protein B/AmmeMemoRadiSam system protein A